MKLKAPTYLELKVMLIEMGLYNVKGTYKQSNGMHIFTIKYP